MSRKERTISGILNAADKTITAAQVKFTANRYYTFSSGEPPKKQNPIKTQKKDAQNSEELQPLIATTAL